MFFQQLVITVFACLHMAKLIVLSLAGALFPVDIPTAYKASHEQPEP